MTDTGNRVKQDEPQPEHFVRRAKSLDEAAHEHSRQNYPHFRRRAFVNRQIARDLEETA